MAGSLYLQPTDPNSFVSSIPIKGVTSVMKNGNDATGLVERLDKPFKTYGAAAAAVAAFYTGGNSPSSTNRVLIDVYPGFYEEQISLLNFVDVNLRDAVFNHRLAGATNATINDSGGAVNCIIWGNGIINRDALGATANSFGLQLLNASTVTIYCNSINSSLDAAIDINNNANVKVFGDVKTTAANFGAIKDNAGGALTYNLSITGNVTNGLNGTINMQNIASTIVINGNLISAGTGGLLVSNGLFYVRGNLSANDNMINVDAGALDIIGNVTMVDTNQSAIVTTGGVTKVVGNVVGNIDMAGGTYLQYGNVNVDGVEAFSCEAGTGFVYGNITSTGAQGIFGTGGSLIVYGNVISSSGATPAVDIDTSTLVINGDCYSNGASSTINVNGTASFTLNGTSYNTVDPGGSAYALVTTGGIVKCEINGDLISQGQVAALLNGTSATLNNSRIVTKGANKDACSSASFGNIFNGCVFIATGTGKSLTAGSNATIYGACQGNKALGAGVTLRVGIITIDSNVI